jgi:hypothetical protein
MSTLSSKSGISKLPQAKLFTELRANGQYISAKTESNIRSNFQAWICENKKNGIKSSVSEKKKKFHEIATTILTFSKSQGIFDDLSDLEQENSECSFESSNIQMSLPEVDLRWIVEEKVHKKVHFKSHPPLLIPKSSLRQTRLQILVMDIIISRYLSDSL